MFRWLFYACKFGINSVRPLRPPVPPCRGGPSSPPCPVKGRVGEKSLFPLIFLLKRTVYPAIGMLEIFVNFNLTVSPSAPGCYPETSVGGVVGGVFLLVPNGFSQKSSSSVLTEEQCFLFECRCRWCRFSFK